MQHVFNIKDSIIQLLISTIVSLPIILVIVVVAIAVITITISISINVTAIVLVYLLTYKVILFLLNR